MLKSAGLACIVAASLAVSTARAVIIDLTTKGATGASQGALFYQTDPQPTGTGYINPFVRIQRTGSERGYNTDARPVEFDTKDENQWTHSLKLADLVKFTVGSKEYYKFSLDINEKGSTGGSLLSMNDLRLYLGDSGSLTHWNDGFGSHSVKVYDLDGATETRVELNAKLNPPGSGVGDMAVYVPVSLFQGHSSNLQYVYLYSAFGSPNGSDSGFEEWSSRTNPFSSSPEPSSMVLAFSGVLLLGFSRLRSLRRRPQAGTE